MSKKPQTCFCPQGIRLLLGEGKYYVRTNEHIIQNHSLSYGENTVYSAEEQGGD